jgi:hypothetical protein
MRLFWGENRGRADKPRGTVDANSPKEVTDTCDEIEAALEAQRRRAPGDAPGQIAHQVPGNTTGKCICSEEVPR